jgi:DNA repair ATPase RecN
MADTERKFTQLDDDVRAIYVMVDDMKRDVRTLRGSVLQQGNRLNQIEADLQDLGDAVGKVGLKIDSVERTQGEHGMLLARLVELLEPK